MLILALLVGGPLREVLKFCILTPSKVMRAQRCAEDGLQFPFGNGDALTQKFVFI